jgi:hypothetical protein
MKTNFSLLFYLKKPKNYLKGAVPVYLRITVDGKPVEISASRKCEPELWNTKAGHMIGTKEDSKTLNSYLDKMKAGVTAAHTALCVEDAEISAEGVKCKYLGKAEKAHTIMEAIKIHNTNMAALVEKEDYAEGTLRRFKVLEKHVKEYLLFKYQTVDLNVRNIDREFIDGFDFYLHTSKDNDTNTASKHLKNLGKIVRICLRNKWIITDPLLWL